MDKQSTSKINIFILLIALVAIGIAVLTVISDEKTGKEIAGETREEAVMKKSFDYMDATKWDRSEDFLESAKSMASDQKITGVLQDPNDANIFYISTLGSQESSEEGFGALPTSHLASIYRYEYDSRQWERIYREQIEEGSKPQLRDNSLGRYTVVGYDSGKLILALESWIGHDGCYSPIDGSHNHSDLLDILSMDLENPYNEFLPYELPEDVVEEAQAEGQECLRRRDSYGL